MKSALIILYRIVMQNSLCLGSSNNVDEEKRRLQAVSGINKSTFEDVSKRNSAQSKQIGMAY